MGDILGYAFIVAAIIFFVYGIWVERKYDQIADRLNEMMEEKDMKFKKDGKVYESFEDALDAFFLGDHKIFVQGEKAEFKFPDDARQSMIRAFEDADMGSVRLYAKLMGYEVIEDGTPYIREVFEKYGEDVKRRLTRADILHAAEKCVCGQRETDYGTPEDNFKAIAELWEAYLNKACARGVNVCVEAKDVAVMMALLKIARIAAGGGKADSWIDLAGYAACGAECEGVTE